MITINYEDPLKLWNMNNLEFNKWRRENDLPVLFEYFSNKLPLFNDWMKDNKFSLSTLLEIIPTGSLFKGDSSKVFVKYNDSKDITYSKILNEVNLKTIKHDVKNKVEEERRVIPYFLWAQRKMKVKKFISFQLPNKGLTNTFVYNSKRTVKVLNKKIKRTALYNEFEVLKLGNVNFNNFNNLMDLKDRNLDFTDMDDVQIFNEFICQGLDISYSTCCNMKIHNSKIYFFNFYECYMDNFNCDGSSLQDVYFNKCEFHTLNQAGISISNSVAYKLEFNKCDIWKIMINDCEIDELNYIINRNGDSSFQYDNLRRIRTSFQNKGNRSETSKYYILERKYEFKMLLKPPIDPRERKNYPKLFNKIEIINLTISFFRKDITGIELLKNIYNRIVYYFKIFCYPKYIFNYKIMNKKIKFISSFFENIFWGYGEKPSRTLIISFLLILFYSYIYKINRVQLKSVQNYVDSLYFSIITFSTLGYGDVLPLTSKLKLICGSEAILGIVCTGMFVAGFANKSKY